MEYKLTSGSSSFNINANDVEDLNIIKLDHNRYHLLDGSTKVEIELLSIDNKTLELLVNGNKHQVVIEDQYDLLVEKMGLSKLSSNIISSIKAPMPGLIIDLYVEEGQKLEEGEPLLILEAMKMENVIKSSGTGVVKSVHVTKGNNVEKGQLMIELE